MAKLIQNIIQVIINRVSSKSTIIIAFCCGLLVSHLFNKYGLQCSEKHESLHDNSFFVVVLILSAPKNLEQRNAIRETWLNLRPRIINNSFYNTEVILLPKVNKWKGVEQETVETQRLLLEKYKQWLKLETQNIKVGDYKVKHYFAIGTKNLDSNLERKINDEQAVFSDMLLLPDFVDSYNNLTSKLLLSLDYIENHLDYNYLLKCDDDTYVKLDILSQDLLDYHHTLIEKNFGTDFGLYWGYFNGRAQIKSSGKWMETNYTLCDRYLPYALGGMSSITYSIIYQ